MPQEVKSTNPTLYNVTPEQMIKLQQLALQIVGKRSVSALVRHIADHGFITDATNGYSLVVLSESSRSLLNED